MDIDMLVTILCGLFILYMRSSDFSAALFEADTARRIWLIGRGIGSWMLGLSVLLAMLFMVLEVSLRGLVILAFGAFAGFLIMRVSHCAIEVLEISKGDTGEET